jgi:meso-butanediol dehydrogenase/(S,S)-butanediol dehydrogenase/diacetyl reductase
VAIVTGAGRGIGRAIALRLGLEGVAVAATDIDEANAATVADEIGVAGGQAVALRVDVTKKTDAERGVRETVARFGRLDILVTNAGIIAVAPLIDTDEATWDALMNVNAKGVLLCAQAAARQMIAQGDGGRIIVIASGAGKRAVGADRPFGAYVAAKHAAVGLTKQLACELASHQILVNCVCPGIIDTAMWDKLDREIAQVLGKPTGSIKATEVASIPVGRIGEPEDVANLVAFLASADATFITSQAFNVCGGRLPY